MTPAAPPPPSAPSMPAAPPPPSAPAPLTHSAPPPPPASTSSQQTQSTDSAGNIKHRLFSSGTAERKVNQYTNAPEIDVGSVTINGSSSTTGTKIQSGKVTVDDSRFKWTNANQLPKPRPFQGKTKLYPSGKGTSVPLDISSYA